jgi:membrane associated rhomboid family serine protease
MFPINDTEPNRYGTIPLMTLSIIAVNTIILILVPADYSVAQLWRFGFTPFLINNGGGPGFTTAITATFLHGGWFHLGGNMLALWVFGRRLEDACGAWRFLAYYLLAGIIGHVMTTLVSVEDYRSSIGASGAVYGVMGAYLLLFPEGRIRTWVLMPLPAWPRIRAGWVVLYFLVTQIGPALDIALNHTMYSTGHWAHLGGFMACIFIPLFMRPEAFARYLSNVGV